jgi:hypothetical protein
VYLAGIEAPSEKAALVILTVFAPFMACSRIDDEGRGVDRIASSLHPQTPEIATIIVAARR